MAFRIAYFKVHHPLAYYATYFTVRADFDASLALRSVEELRQMINKIQSKGNDATAKEKNTMTVCEVLVEAKMRNVKFFRGFISVRSLSLPN